MHALALCTLALASLAAARPQQFHFNQVAGQQQRQHYPQQQQLQQQPFLQQQFVPPQQQQQQQQAFAQPQQLQQLQQQQFFGQQQFAFRDEAATSSTTPIPIISYLNEASPDGSYRYSYETGNGIKAEESGKINNPGLENEALAVRGSYSYIGDDGQTYSVQYVADENGFQPVGAHLPTAPPLPAELQKAIDEHLAALATAQPDEAEQTSTQDQRHFPQRHF